MSRHQTVVIPLKNGNWRVIHVSPRPRVIEGATWLSYRMYQRWERAYGAWWERKGKRLAISPEMWME